MDQVFDGLSSVKGVHTGLVQGSHVDNDTVPTMGLRDHEHTAVPGALTGADNPEFKLLLNGLEDHLTVGLRKGELFGKDRSLVGILQLDSVGMCLSASQVERMGPKGLMIFTDQTEEVLLD